MPPRKTRFVTVCQQLLTLGVICAVVTPATGVLSLELVPEDPGAQSAGGVAPPPDPFGAQFAAYGEVAQRAAVVPTEVVEPTVTEVPLTAPAGARVAPRALKSTERARGNGRTEVLSDTEDVTGYAAVGVTWQHGEELEESEIAVQVRTRENGGWSAWDDVEYHDEHGPDAGTPEGRRSRPGTEPVLVGEVEKVQVKVNTAGATPDDLSLAVIDPGEATATATEKPAIDTTAGDPDQQGRATIGGDLSDAAPAAAATAPRPQIFSRAQWGADERLRSGRPSYGTIRAGFVHHTVNANDYSKAQVPALLRGIYAYHTKSRGWSDVGYNFLVDRFGRIWEGRAGGVDKAVVGAHTLNYNSYSFAMSAIGNYETARPSEATVQAYGALMAWKLSLAGVRANATNVAVGRSRFQAISGHRDAGSTACPGRYLYARLPDIRRLATAAQDRAGSGTPAPTPAPTPTPDPSGGSETVGDLVGSAHPDLVLRRASDNRIVVVPIQARGRSFTTGAPLDTGLTLTGVNRILNAGDWDGDGRGDLLVRRTDGRLVLYPGTGDGRFAAGRTMATGFRRVGLLAAGDVTGDGRPDVVGQPAGGGLTLWAGDGEGGIRAAQASSRGRVDATRQVLVGLWDGDAKADALVRRGPRVILLPGSNATRTRTFGRDFKPYDWTVGVSDVGLTGRQDLVLRERSTGRLLLSQTSKNGSVGAPKPLSSANMRGYDLIG